MRQSEHVDDLQTPSTDFASGPAHPLQPDKVIQSLKRALESVECPGGQLTQIQFGRLCGVKSTTMNFWLCTDHAAQIVKFLCALERLPESQRTQLLKQLCRDCPRLNHVRLAHDPKGVELLAKLLKQPSGLTLVSAPSDELRSFILTALGNSATMVNEKLRVCGLDVHQPISFSPVPGMFYLKRAMRADEIRQEAAAAWPQIERSKASVVLFNGIWSANIKLRENIFRLAESRNVFVADSFDSASMRSALGSKVVSRVVRSLPHKTKPDRITVSVDAGVC